MKYEVFAATVLVLLAISVFWGSAVAGDAPENLTGTWVEATPERHAYTLVIEGDNIIITWRNEVICNTRFRMDGATLQNTKKRENWQEYVESHQHEQFCHFERIELLDGGLTGFIFIADKGYYKLPFVKRP